MAHIYIYQQWHRTGKRPSGWGRCTTSMALELRVMWKAKPDHPRIFKTREIHLSIQRSILLNRQTYTTVLNPVISEKLMVARSTSTL